MTEEEAKTKWCPFVRFAPVVPGFSRAHTNRSFVIEEDSPDAAVVRATKCIASDCMAWRWLCDTTKVAPHREKHRPGCCGLAGAPQ